MPPWSPRVVPPLQGLRLLGMGTGMGDGASSRSRPSPPLLIILFLNQGIRINTSLLMLW